VAEPPSATPMCLKVVESPPGVDLSPSKLMRVAQPSINYFGVVYPLLRATWGP
jgi:hypothetical protein